LTSNRDDKILPLGKINPDLLRDVIIPRVGSRSKNVLIRPMHGYDCGVAKPMGPYEVMATDPVLGVPRSLIGFFTFHFPASDISVFGVKPQYLVYTLLLPPSSRISELEEIVSDVDKECKKYSVSIVSGHTGVYDSIKIPISVSTAIGYSRREDLITPGNAKPGDKILIVKELGLETLVMFAFSNEDELSDIIGRKEAKNLRSRYDELTCVDDAIYLASHKVVNAMHDITEGGLSTALPEMADASGLGFVVYEEKLPLNRHTKIFCENYRIDPLSLSSTGTLLCAVPEKFEEKTRELLEKRGVTYSFVGEFLKDRNSRFLSREGHLFRFPEYMKDPYSELIKF